MSWFEKDFYLGQKLELLKVTDPKGTLNGGKAWTNTAEVEAAFVKAGMTAEQHFSAYGDTEGLSPNHLFNVKEYYAAKAAQLNAEGGAKWTDASVKAAFEKAGLSAWDHYTQYGDVEGVNPSNQFDDVKYYTAKAVAMNAEKFEGKTDWNATSVEALFEKQNMNPLDHYLTYAGKTNEPALITDGNNPYIVDTPVVPTPDPDPSNPGETFYLGVGQDSKVGTAGDDTFVATIFDNQNTLQSGDRIDGGAGVDTLTADLGNSNNFAITPETVNVEIVKFRAEAQITNAPEGDHAPGGNNIGAAHIDAERMQGVKEFWSDNSRADLTIEDVRIDSNTVKIGMHNTDSGDVDLSVYFDAQHLKADAALTTGTLTLQLIDTVAAAETEGKDPLRDNPYTGFKFSFDGKEYAINFGTYNVDSDKTPSYEELAALIQKTINDDATLSKLGLSVTTGESFDAVVGIGEHSGQHVTGLDINITSSLDGAFSGGKWVAANGLPETNSVSATMSNGATDTCPLISTTIALDNVGRVLWDDASACLPDDSLFGSQAGDLVVGSMATRGGVERFNLEVLNEGSWLSSMASTNNTLRYVEVTENTKDAQLFIGDSLLDTDGDFTPTENMADWNDATRLLDTDGLVDVKTFDADKMTGDVNIGASFTAATYEKYLRDVDGTTDINSGYAPNGPFMYTTGSGDDTINMDVNGGVAADRDFVLHIETNKGDDLVNFNLNKGLTDNQLTNQQALKNITISTGEGDDIIQTPGAGSVIIDAGAGNDVIFTDNTGKQHLTKPGQPVTLDSNAVWVVNTNSAAGLVGTHYRDIYMDGINGAQPLNNDALGANNDTTTVTGAVEGGKLQVVVNFMGVEVTADVKAFTAANMNADKSYSVLDADINAAIIKAVNDDPILGNLLDAKDGAGYSLILESLMDGQMTAADLAISFKLFGKDATTSTAFTTTNLAEQYNGDQFGQFDNTTAIHANVVGANAAEGESDNFVTGGMGNDLIVLGTHALSNDTLVFEGNFGTDTVMNFDVTTPTKDNGGDVLDFSAYLGNVAAPEFVGTLTGITTTQAVIAIDGSSYKDAAAVIEAINASTGVAGDKGSNYVYLVSNLDGNKGLDDYTVFTAGADAKSTDIKGAAEVGKLDLNGVTLGDLSAANFHTGLDLNHASGTITPTPDPDVKGVTVVDNQTYNANGGMFRFDTTAVGVNGDATITNFSGSAVANEKDYLHFIGVDADKTDVKVSLGDDATDGLITLTYSPSVGNVFVLSVNVGADVEDKLVVINGVDSLNDVLGGYGAITFN